MTVCALIAVTLGMGLPAQKVPSRDVLVVFATGPGVEQDLAEDVTEAVAFSLGKEKESALRFMPKERVTGRLGYLGPESPGSCLFDNQCLRRIRRVLGARVFIVARLRRDRGAFGISLVRIADRAASDRVEAARIEGGAVDVINKVRALAVASMEVAVATFVFSVNDADAAVEIGGRVVGHGSVTVPVKPGSYKVKVSKAGFVPFEATLRCTADRQCIVPVNLLRVQSAVGRNPARPGDGSGSMGALLGESADPTPRLLRIGGWSAAGAGAVMIVVGSIYGAKAARLSTELDDACASAPCQLSRADAAAKLSDANAASDLFNGLAIPGMVLVAAGVASAVVGYLIEPPAEGEGRVEVSPVVAPESVFLRATVHF